MADQQRPGKSLDGGVKISRREVLGAGGALLLGGGLAGAFRHRARSERGLKADVFIGRAVSYESDLPGLIQSGLAELGFDRPTVRGRRIVLKPNLVETALESPHINTHPAVVVAAAEVFRRWDAKQVLIAEGQGHRRDSQLVLDESGMGTALAEAGLSFVDLNHDEVKPIANTGGFTSMEKLYLPRALLEADLIVSMPKLKTHHWAGVTCAMKNLFGVMPGIVYGWPKNVLHREGIAQSILDINTTVQPSLAIVDGIVGMEGDGPIMGAAKQVGCLIMGRNLPAVDASATRVMQLNPYGIAYLKHASGLLGPIHEWNITQRGESIASVASKFDILDEPHLRAVATV